MLQQKQYLSHAQNFLNGKMLRMCYFRAFVSAKKTLQFFFSIIIYLANPYLLHIIGFCLANEKNAYSSMQCYFQFFASWEIAVLVLVLSDLYHLVENILIAAREVQLALLSQG